MECRPGPADIPGVNIRAKRKLTVFSIAMMAMGLLLWARLILVTGRPRTALAQPQPQAVEPEAPSASGEQNGANDPVDLPRLEQERAGQLDR